MKLATSTGDFQTYTSRQEDCVRYIHQAGFKYVDYNFHMDYSRQTGIFSQDWRGHLENVRRVADELGIAFVQSHSPMGRPIVLDDAHEGFVEATKRCIESCAVLGIDRIVVHSGYAPGLSKEETFEKNRDFYLELLPMAERFGVNVLVENFNRMCVDGLYWIDNAPDLRTMIDCVNHPLLHACWDAGHGNMQETPQDEALRILGGHVYALHVQDNMGDQDTHIAPLFGTLNLDSLMHGLQDIGYQGYFTFEAGNFFLPGERRRPFEKDQRMLDAPLELKIKAERLLYEIGRYTLEAYDCFEE